MSKYCKMEFSFRRKDMEDLLQANPDANSVIVRQEIKFRKKADDKGHESITYITAYAKNISAVDSTVGDDCPPIDGCPYPPGCNQDGTK